jgi:hypothetical protein
MISYIDHSNYQRPYEDLFQKYILKFKSEAEAGGSSTSRSKDGIQQGGYNYLVPEGGFVFMLRLSLHK